ncbi:MULTISPECIES: urea amidolyase family protein [unclassified Aureimonas]|uniref:5-oxoprolinase subunit B/C family protein n=1 Tax=unclassified Aureimonas TaxID=2615206 RepID=UPI0006F6ABE7|nr:MULTISPECIES: urea amidolyase family protein [unclassified Aureimonas]KQT62921.1 allophanate hydrolase [Aureimonas sp. Leaf427]KQT74841.1 allophanate hydrolase [Aureimonas sp. Leaf460]
MVDRLRFLPCGGDGLLVELADLETTLTLLDRLLAARPEGVTEIVPAAHTVLVRFNPLFTSPRQLADVIARNDLSLRSEREGEVFEIPVVYDGEDLADVAEHLGWSIEEVVRRHSDATYTVAFTGFAPGFAYMTCDDPGFDVPRRKSPRVRIPAGSVAIAGKFGGIYPSDSPGGWQILGTTPLRMWDTGRERAAMLAPGDRVRFRRISAGAHASSPGHPEQTSQAVPAREGLLVTRADRPAFFQDLGRAGMAGQGVSKSGALDRAAIREANLCVGNRLGEAAIEITYGGFALLADRPVTVAAAGAPCYLTIRRTNRPTVSAPTGRPFALDAGDELVFEAPAEGMRSYLAVRGGFSVDPVLGSASTDTLAKVGPAPIARGEVLVPADRANGSVDPDRPQQKALPTALDTVWLDVVLGPRTDWFTDHGLRTLLAQDWTVTAASSRVGMRLSGATPLERRDTAELASEGTVPGAIQVPHDGQPVLFLADHPITGGYPVIGVLAAHHLDLAGQIPIGARIRFKAVTAFEPQSRETER